MFGPRGAGNPLETRLPTGIESHPSGMAQAELDPDAIAGCRKSIQQCGADASPTPLGLLRKASSQTLLTLIRVGVPLLLVLNISIHSSTRFPGKKTNRNIIINFIRSNNITTSTIIENLLHSKNTTITNLRILSKQTRSKTT